MGEVLLIGGSPMVGKSTIAKEIASKIKYSCLSTDDIGEILQTAIDINPMEGMDHLDYYAAADKNRLIYDIIEYHRKMEPAIRRLIDIHSTWGSSIILEGWALYPSIVKAYDRKNVKAIWLIAENKLLEQRFKDNHAFYKNTMQLAKVMENFLYRSFWHNHLLLEKCKAESEKYICIDGSEDICLLTGDILRMFEG